MCISRILHVLLRLIRLQTSPFRFDVPCDRNALPSTRLPGLSLNCHRWASLDISRRDEGSVPTSRYLRSFDRGGCSQDLLFLLLLVILILSFPSSSSSQSSSTSSPHPLLSSPLQIALTKELSLSGIEPVILRLKAQ